MVNGDVLLIGKQDSHDRDREKSRFVLQHIGGRERRNDGHEGNRILQEVGNQESLQQLVKNQRADRAGEAAGDNCEQESFGREAGDAGHFIDQDRLEDQHRQERADGIDKDALPLENGTNILLRFDVAQERHDDGGPGHGQDGAQQDGNVPRPIERVFRGCGGRKPGDQRADGDQIAHHPADGLYFAYFQREAAFVENHGDRERDQRHQGVADEFVGIDQAEDGSGRKPANPQTSSRRMEGMRSRQASHCAPMPRTMISVTLSRISWLMDGFGDRVYPEIDVWRNSRLR